MKPKHAAAIAKVERQIQDGKFDPETVAALRRMIGIIRGFETLEEEYGGPIPLGMPLDAPQTGS